MDAAARKRAFLVGFEPPGSAIIRHMGEPGTARYHWNFPICPNRVTIDLSVLRALEHDLLNAEEQQGLLFGKEQPGATHVNGREALTALGREEIRRALDDARRTVVGFYRIRAGRAFILTTDELEIARDLFRSPASLVLLIERRGAGPAEASFFFWRGDSFVHNLPMPFPLDVARLAALDSGAVSAKQARPFFSRRYAVLLQRLGAIGAGAAAGVALAAVLMHSPSRTPGRGGVKTPAAADDPVAAAAPRHFAAVEFVWDPKSLPPSTAGLLEVDDGGTKHEIPLDAEQLQAGSLPYTPKSDLVRVELSTLQRDGRVVDALVSTRAVGGSGNPASQGPAVPAPVEPPSRHEEKPAAAARQPERATFEASPLKKVDTAPATNADRRVALKPFTLMAVRGEAMPQPVTLDPPPIEAEPAGSAALLPIAPALRAHVPPPSPPVTTPVHAAALAGRVIWTGTLMRRGVVELDGRAASIGSLSGALPGMPVAVSISPAEFEGDGLIVYTLEAGRNNRTEPASAANGWNKVKWVWDPARVHEIAILESPNASNGFNRLAFRSDARRTSMVWIDWRAR
jgi:hypothetical protein